MTDVHISGYVAKRLARVRELRAQIQILPSSDVFSVGGAKR